MENKETQIAKSIKDVSLMLNKPYISYVFKKTQKIAQAIYLITDYFDPAETLRFSMRMNANTLLNSATNFLKNGQKDKHHSSDILSATFLETLAFLETASLINVLSDKNHLILKDEINRVLGTLETEKEKGILLSREFIETASLEEYKRQAPESKGQDTVLNIKDMSVIAKKEPVMPKIVQKENKTKRLDVMLSIFKPGVDLMIKDITLHLKDVSEKTIQRELLSLVEQGKLKKIGKKRWSKYRLG